MLDEDDGVGVADRRGQQPLASAGVAGITTLMPGMCATMASRLLECCAPAPAPAPPWVRSTKGSVTWSPQTKGSTEAWFSSWSRQSGRKSTYMISATGFSPIIEAPTAMPAITCSEIGVSRTRSGPNSACMSRVTLKTPP